MNLSIFVKFLLLVLFGAGFFATRFAFSKDDARASVALGVCIVFLICLMALLIVGPVKQDVTAQRNPPALSQDAQIVQKLLRGEEVAFRQVPPFMPLTVFFHTAEGMRLPPETIEKIRDHRHYYLRFDTNDVITTTNR